MFLLNFTFFKKLFSTFSSALHSTGPATIPAINQIKTPKTKPPTALQADPPKKAFFHRLLQGKAVFYRRLAPKAKNNFFGLVQSSPLHRCLPTAALRGEVFHCKVQLSLRTWSTLLWSTLELHTTCVLPLPSPPPTFRPPPLQTNLRRTQAWGPRI